MQRLPLVSRLTFMAALVTATLPITAIRRNVTRIGVAKWRGISQVHRRWHACPRLMTLSAIGMQIRLGTILQISVAVQRICQTWQDFDIRQGRNKHTYTVKFFQLICRAAGSGVVIQTVQLGSLRPERIAGRFRMAR